MSRRSDLPGAKLHVTFTNGKSEHVILVTPPLGSNYQPRPGGTPEADAANAGCPLWVVAKLGLKATGTLAFQAAVTYTGGKTLLAGKSIIEQQLARGLTAGTAGIGAAETAGSGAESAVAGRSLARQLASEQQLGEAGTPLAGAGTATKLRAADRLAADYGGEAADWAKMGSSSFRGADGFQFETHWYENVLTGVRTEFKTKFLWLP